jgi:hypothetical protein
MAFVGSPQVGNMNANAVTTLSGLNSCSHAKQSGRQPSPTAKNYRDLFAGKLAGFRAL